MAKIRIAGLDGALRNFGIARMLLDIQTLELSVEDLKLVETVPSKDKKVRVSSDNLSRAQMIARAIRDQTSDCAICFAEVPSGAQDAKAAISFGMVIGLYASIQKPLIEVSPFETKLAAVGTRTASKQEMIDWAFEKFPTAPWLTTKRAGNMVPTLKNEHLADAVAIVSAGIHTPAFQQTLAILRANTITQSAA